MRAKGNLNTNGRYHTLYNILAKPFRQRRVNAGITTEVPVQNICWRAESVEELYLALEELLKSEGVQ